MFPNCYGSAEDKYVNFPGKQKIPIGESP
jgi:hypothetical protein